MKFTEVLRELMIENDIDIKQLAKATNIHLASLYFYFKNDTIPDVDSAIKLSEYFNCSINFLLGLVESDNVVVNNTNKMFIDNYSFLLEINNTNNFKVCNDLNYQQKFYL